MQPHPKEPHPTQLQLLQHFTVAAARSTWCQEYMYMPSYYSSAFNAYREGEVYLEVALLVACCRFSTQDVLQMMVRLAKRGMLLGYRKGWTGLCDMMLRRIGRKEGRYIGYDEWICYGWEGREMGGWGGAG